MPIIFGDFEAVTRHGRLQSALSLSFYIFVLLLVDYIGADIWDRGKWVKADADQVGIQDRPVELGVEANNGQTRIHQKDLMSASASRWSRPWF